MSVADAPAPPTTAPDPGHPRLSVTGLACRRGGRTVFTGFEVQLKAGDGLIVTGANGCGKTTLLRCLTGLLPPHAGEILVAPPPDRAVPLGFVGDRNPVKPHLTVAENARVAAGLAGASDAAAIDRALAAFDLTGLANSPGRHLSAGQTRRTALAQLVASGAWLWLLDEPMTTLDAANRGRLEAEIAVHRAGGGIVVVATHDAVAMDDARSIDLSRTSK